MPTTCDRFTVNISNSSAFRTIIVSINNKKHLLCSCFESSALDDEYKLNFFGLNITIDIATKLKD